MRLLAFLKKINNQQLDKKLNINSDDLYKRVVINLNKENYDAIDSDEGVELKDSFIQNFGLFLSKRNVKLDVKNLLVGKLNGIMSENDFIYFTRELYHITRHPVLFLKFDTYSLYIPFTNGLHYKLVYLGFGNNKLISNVKILSVNDFTVVKTGCFHIQTKDCDSMLEVLLKNKNLFNYYDLHTNIFISLDKKGKKIVKELFERTGSRDLSEFRLNLLCIINLNKGAQVKVNNTYVEKLSKTNTVDYFESPVVVREFNTASVEVIKDCIDFLD